MTKGLLTLFFFSLAAGFENRQLEASVSEQSGYSFMELWLKKISYILMVLLLQQTQILSQNNAQLITDEDSQRLFDELRTSQDFLTRRKLIQKIAVETLKAPNKMKGAIPLLIEILRNDTDSYVQMYAAVILGEMGTQADAAVPVLIDILQDKKAEEEVQVYAVNALGKIGAKATPAVPFLIERLNNKNWAIQALAMEALGKIGPNAIAATQLLIEKLQNEDIYIKQLAITALGGIGSQEAIFALIKEITNDDIRVIKHVTEALVRIGTNAVPLLIESFTSSKNWQVRIYISDILGEIGYEAKSAIPILINAINTLSDSDNNSLYSRLKIAKALIKIEPKAIQTVPALPDALQYKPPKILFSKLEGNHIIKIDYESQGCFHHAKYLFIFRKQVDRIKVEFKETPYQGSINKDTKITYLSEDIMKKLDNLLEYYRQIEKIRGVSTTIERIQLEMRAEDKIIAQEFYLDETSALDILRSQSLPQHFQHMNKIKLEGLSSDNIISFLELVRILQEKK